MESPPTPATKRSRFGEENSVESEKIRETTEFCVKAGFSFHFVDAERPKDYMNAQEFDTILSSAEELESDLTTVATINARHLFAFELTKDYLEVATQHDNVGFCFVAGNRSYLTEEEPKLDPQRRIKELVSISRTRLPPAKIFVGTEGLFELAFQLGIKYSAIPFALLGDSGEH